jgi:Arc/MetJ-type ribon-helix-helix transcriptional regulator
MKTLSLRLPDHLDAQLTTMAEKQGAPKSELVRRALERMLSGQDPDRPKSFLEMTRDAKGCVEGPSDLSTNQKHLEGFGK